MSSFFSSNKAKPLVNQNVELSSVSTVPSTPDKDGRLDSEDSWGVYLEEFEQDGGINTILMSPSWVTSMRDLDERDQLIAQRLAMRAFHLPGNSFWEDWHQFLNNNHPVFGFCLADPRHPFGFRERCVNLMSSLAFGLAATSCVVLWYFYQQQDPREVVLDVWLVQIEHEMISLLVFGGMVHVIFDLGIWFVQACPCLHGPDTEKYINQKTRSCCLTLGSHLAIEVTLISVFMATYVMLLRASVNDDGNTNGFSRGVEDYLFILTYTVETVIAQFIMFPVVAFTIFTGVLGCGRIPGIGGRPYQVWRLEQKKKRRESQLRKMRLQKTGVSDSSTLAQVEV